MKFKTSVHSFKKSHRVSITKIGSLISEIASNFVQEH
jgi:hypothetical protein